MDHLLLVVICLLLTSQPVVPFTGDTPDFHLVQTPPMGWATWLGFGCAVDCSTHPKQCLNEDLIQRTADKMYQDGWVRAGYNYLVIGDCWSMKQRESRTCRLVPDKQRFPHGFQALSQYLRQRGIHLGLTLNYGEVTCNQYPGSLHYLGLDANTLSEWGVEYIKLDGCYTPPENLEAGFERFWHHLKKTYRPIVFSCTYPAFIPWTKNYNLVNWDKLNKMCHSWRVFGNMDGTWNTTNIILNQYIRNSHWLGAVATIGHWNDLDVLAVGKFNLTYDQKRLHIGMWCMWSVSLFISTDLDIIDNSTADLLRNPNLIAIHQDPLGYPAVFIRGNEYVQCWCRQLSGISNIIGAIAVINLRPSGKPVDVSVNLRYTLIPIGQVQASRFRLIDAFTNKELRVVRYTELFQVTVNSTGIAIFLVQPLW